MGRNRITNLRHLIGIIKDKASQSKASFIFNPKSFSLHLSLLKATTHDSFTAPNERHLTAFLDIGNSSRATSAVAVDALMNRLQTTRDASVALKCLIVIHHVIKNGGFIILDRLAVYPSGAGGRNYLNLSKFRDDTTPVTWELSSWLRWYAQYIEHVLSTSRLLGFFLSSISITKLNKKEDEKISGLMTSELLRQTDGLVSLLEEACKRPDPLHLPDNDIVKDVIGLIGEDYLSTINQISVRINEFRERLSCLSFNDSIELDCTLKRLEDCRERLTDLSHRKKVLIEIFWGLIKEVKGEIENIQCAREGKMLITLGKRDKSSESVRFAERVLSYNDSIRFSSRRLLSDKLFPMAIVESYAY